MGRVEGKVAVITGAARSQGRSHALRLAAEGADIIAIDLCAPVRSVGMYPPSTEEDLAETVRLVEELDRRVVSRVADVRDSTALRAAVDDGVAELGRLDIVSANAGIFEIHPALEITDDDWREMIDTNLTGVWNTCRAALPHLVDGGRGGSIVITSSTAGIKGVPNTVHYTAAKHGVVGIMRTLANEFAQHSIRVNTVHPTGVDTVMIQNRKTWGLFLGGEQGATREAAEPAFASSNALPVPWVDPVDISNAILWLLRRGALRHRRHAAGGRRVHHPVTPPGRPATTGDPSISVDSSPEACRSVGGPRHTLHRTHRTRGGAPSPRETRHERSDREPGHR